MTGLLTFTEADNYGALLQAYALQQTLDKIGCDNVFLNFNVGKAGEHRDLTQLPPLLRKRIEETMYYHNKRSSLFDDFRKKYLRMSERMEAENTESLNGEYDRFIVGSDQVWNYGVTGGNLLYALPFAEPAKRFSYAASFGGAEGINKASERLWEELSLFNSISLREEEGAGLCKNKTGIIPQINIDPSMLLTKAEWERLIFDQELRSDSKEDCVFEGDKYVLLFLIEYDNRFTEMAKGFADECGLSLRVVTASYIPMFGFECFAGIGVIDWLKLIHDAEYVFCDSFHASVFSILFEKKFIPNISKTGLNGRSSRFLELFDKFNLRADVMNEETDHIKVNRILEKERERAIAYLKQITE